MKVLYVSPNGYLGGAERFVLEITKLHKENSHIQCAILFYNDGEAVNMARANGIDVFVLRSKFKLSHPLSLSKALKEIRSIIKKYNPDILHHTMPYAHITSSLASTGLLIKKVWFQHGPVNGNLDQLANFFPADVILYNSEDLKARHHKTLIGPIVTEEAVIHIGVPTSETRQIFNDSVCRLGSAGRICSWKGFHIILLALAKLREKDGFLPLKFTLAGSAKTDHDQEYFLHLIELIRTHQLEDIVELKNHVSEIKSFYQSLDVFIHSSTIPEPFGLVVAEAMGQGCLVVGSDSGGVRDLLKDGMTGLSYGACGEHAIDELVQILSRILSSFGSKTAQSLSDLAHNGQELVKNDYSPRRMSENMEKVYTHLVFNK